MALTDSTHIGNAHRQRTSATHVGNARRQRTSLNARAIALNSCSGQVDRKTRYSLFAAEMVVESG
jgi:hypothetical protein